MKPNSKCPARTGDDKRSEADDFSVSQHSRKPPVVCRFAVIMLYVILYLLSIYGLDVLANRLSLSDIVYLSLSMLLGISWSIVLIKLHGEFLYQLMTKFLRSL